MIKNVMRSKVIRELLKLNNICKSLLLPDVLQIDKWYKVIILYVHASGMANTAVSFSGLDTILNNSESNNMYFSARASIFLIAD